MVKIIVKRRSNRSKVHENKIVQSIQSPRFSVIWKSTQGTLIKGFVSFQTKVEKSRDKKKGHKRVEIEGLCRRMNDSRMCTRLNPRIGYLSN